MLGTFDGGASSTSLAGLIADAKGDLFGTTEAGGANGYGTVFQIAKTPTGYSSAPITLVSFNGTNGAYSIGGSIADAQGDQIDAIVPDRTGRSFIRGGRADVRQALYMPALVAAGFNPDMKAKHAHLIETGKPAKVALTAIMRKLVVLANAILKANRPRTPKTARSIRIL